jgi:alkaline phosphatase D
MQRLHFYDREDRPWVSGRLTTASIVGHTTSTTVRLWVRVYEQGDYHLVVAREPIPSLGLPKIELTSGENLRAALVGLLDGTKTQMKKVVAIEPHSFSFKGDLTHVFDLSGLKPDSTYYYALVDATRPKPWELGYEEQLSFRTWPEYPREVSFGIWSCHMPFDGDSVKNLHMWDALHREMTDARASFSLGMGDQAYVDGDPRIDIWRWLRKIKRHNPSDEDMVSWYRDIYRGYWGMPQVRRVLRSFPSYMIWDDHEIKDGWGSYTRDELSNELDRYFEWEDRKANLALANRMFAAAKLVYGEYEHSHNPKTPAGQFDYEFRCGPCAFFVLDGRGHRDYEGSAGQRILGTAQLARFEDWLSRARKAEIAFVISPVPTVHASSFIVNHADIALLGLADDLRDEWEHKSNWVERNRLLEAAFGWSEETGKRLVFLSGDVHVSAAFKLAHRRFQKARVFQLTSSGITYATAPPGLKLAVSEAGSLADASAVKDKDRYHFRLIQPVFSGNNFGMIHVRPGEGESTLAYDLFGNAARGDGVLKLKRLVL